MDGWVDECQTTQAHAPTRTNTLTLSSLGRGMGSFSWDRSQMTLAGVDI